MLRLFLGPIRCQQFPVLLSFLSYTSRSDRIIITLNISRVIKPEVDHYLSHPCTCSYIERKQKHKHKIRVPFAGRRIRA
jgi:hypothetical protein